MNFSFSRIFLGFSIYISAGIGIRDGFDNTDLIQFSFGARIRGAHIYLTTILFNFGFSIGVNDDRNRVEAIN